MDDETRQPVFCPCGDVILPPRLGQPVADGSTCEVLVATLDGDGHICCMAFPARAWLTMTGAVTRRLIDEGRLTQAEVDAFITGAEASATEPERGARPDHLRRSRRSRRPPKQS